MKKSSKWRATGKLFLAASVGVMVTAPDAPAENPEALKLYTEEIKPLFQKHCFECHDAKKTRGGLDLTRRVNLMQGGDSGVAIVVGDRNSSLLFKSVTHAVEQKMPHKKDKLADAEIDKIGRWIDAGADYAAEDVNPLSPPLRSLQQRPQGHHAKSKFLANRRAPSQRAH